MASVCNIHDCKRSNDNAYVWLLMKGDKYLPGIYASVYSIIRTTPNADLIIMVTPDVSDECIKILTKLAINVELFVVKIKYLEFETFNLKTQKQENLYSTWKSVSYTKWNILLLPHKKALFLDADVIVTKNIDHLFDIQTPAGPFNNAFVRPFGQLPSYLTGPKGLDGYPEHNTLVDKKEINNMLYRNGTVLVASTILLEPSKEHFDKYVSMMEMLRPFGFPRCFSMVDEQSIVYFYTFILGQDWHNIHHQYNLIAWKKGFLAEGVIPYVIHYFSDVKPWDLCYDAYPDVSSWYKIAAEAIKKTKIKCSDIKLKLENVSKSCKVDDDFIKHFAGYDLDICDIQCITALTTH
jgi:hypothetical protein